MKTLLTIKLLLVAVLFLGAGLSNSLFAQAHYKLTGKPELRVQGSSTIHDWEMASAQTNGKAEMIVEGTSLKSVKSANVTMKSESLKSGKSKMDELAYESLKTDKHSDILFTLTSFKMLDGKKGKATGNLTIAGTTRPVTFEVETTVKAGVVLLSGETNIKFSDFKLTPPTAMMGTIKTGNELKVLFKVNFQQTAAI